MQPYLSIEKLDVTFGRGPMRSEVLRDVSLRVAKGEFIAIIGHSGCGKSTLLNVVAGLVKATGGGVILEDREVNAPGPDRAVVFQHHSLLPWLTVFENVQLAVDKVFRSHESRSERREWVMHNLALVHIEHAKDKRPHEISGGMKQRVGIARALAMEPKVLLLDEPFGALDALTRARLQDSVMEIHGKLGNTVMIITHDVDEAVLLSDRIVMMTNGPAGRSARFSRCRSPGRGRASSSPTTPSTTIAAAPFSNSSTPAASSRPGRHERKRTRARTADRRRQRHGGLALRRGAAGSRRRPLPDHRRRQGAPSGLQPRAAVVAAGGRGFGRRCALPRRRLVCGSWYRTAAGHAGRAHRCERAPPPPRR